MSEICSTYKEHSDRIAEAVKRIPKGDEILETADFFDALGNPTRLKILMAIMDAELCTCDLSAITGLSTSAISHQLRILKDRKIVNYRKKGKNVYYHLDDEHIATILRTALNHIKES